MDYIEENGIIYKIEKDGDFTFSKSVYCGAKKITVTGGKNVIKIGEALPLNVEIMDWQDTPQPGITEPIEVVVARMGADPVNLILAPVNSKAEFDFISNAKGVISITLSTIMPGCDPAYLMVEVEE
ncbi:hypothetical protein [Heliophilum fasciatum]|uniref:hypothetical protein n=1 Tax=Heliophilum fasciatum TaxID=35700 RepID=UPI001050AEE2|nr:hypothetical protein [Heliophilum fasciatum]MCW2278747.1 hypothetical protein [Heliophilum fasciatum]